MPGMTATPTLTVALAPAGPMAIASGKVPQTDDANPAGAAAAASTTDTSAPEGVTTGDAADSFARILQQQMAQTAVTPLPAGAPAQDLAAQPSPAVVLTLDATANPAPPTNPAAPDLLAMAQALDPTAPRPPAAGQVADPAGPGLPTVALETVPTLAPAASAGSAVPLAKPLTAAAPSTDPGAATSGQAAKPDKDADRDLHDADLAAQSPYLLGLVTAAVVARANAPQGTATNAKAEPDGAEQSLPATAALSQMKLGSAGAAPPGLLADAAPGAASKTAEIAAPVTAAGDAAPANANREATAAPSSFDNMLAAAQAFNHGHAAGANHAASHNSTALPVHTPVGTTGWDGEVGDKLTWMVGRQEQRAELVLNPPQLGRVEVSLKMSDGQASALFVSANPAVRDALEAALPRLREILADAGVNLGQAQVGADTGSSNGANQSANNRENWDNPGRISYRPDLANGFDNPRTAVSTQWLKQGNGLVDVFA